MTTGVHLTSIEDIVQSCLTKIEKSSIKVLPDCEQCVDYKFIWHNLNELPVMCNCALSEKRDERKKVASEMFADEYKDYKLANFTVLQGFQRNMLDKAKMFLNTKGIFSILYLGQSGCGKSHLCIAIANEFLLKGASVEFMSYPEWILKLKQHMYNSTEYANMIYKFKKCNYLVIDDFLKSATKRGETNETDLQLVFEIIDYRYRYKNPVIISSEYYFDEISDKSEAIAGRLKQMATHFESNYIIEITRDKTRNFRLKGVHRI